MQYLEKLWKMLKNRMDLHMTTDNDNAIKWFSKINMKDCKTIDGLYLIEMYKKETVHDKPICWNIHFGFK